ncbi:hypothetical protein IV102_01430 [bacterium]|nr:hypothetical protein [bacterium]
MPIEAPEKSEVTAELPLCEPPRPNPRLSSLATVPAARSVDFAPWLPQVLRLAQNDQMEDAVDQLFKEVNRWLRESHFHSCNQLLELPANLFPLKLSVSLLALTKPATARLPARKAFLDEVVSSIEAEGRNSEAVLGRLLR